MTDLGLEHHVEPTRSLEHAQELAHGAAERGELAVAFGGDGLIGAVADAIKHSQGVLGVLPGGRGNDFARVLGIPLEPVPACAVLVTGPSARSTSDRSARRRSSASQAVGLTRTPTGSPTRPGSSAATSSTHTARSGHWPAGSPARLTVTIDGGEPRQFTGYTVAAANSGAYGGGMLMAPDASLEDGLLDVVLVGDTPKLRFLRLLPTVFKGEHVKQPNVEVVRGQRGGDQRRASVHDVRRRRSDRRAAGHGPGAALGGPRDGAPMSGLTVKIAAARAVGELARRAGRGGGTSLPGKVLMRLEPDAIAELAVRLPQGSAVISATNGKTTTAAMAAAILERAGIPLVHNRAGANMAGGVASTLLSASRSRRPDRRRARPVRGRRVLARSGRRRELHPRAVLLGNLFRDQLDRYGELETIADRWADGRGDAARRTCDSCSTPTIR